MLLTKEERVKSVELHFQNNGSVVNVQRNYRKIFGNETSPSKKCIKALVLKFKETGRTEDKQRCGRLRNIRTDASIQRVAASVADTPQSFNNETMLSARNDPLLTAKYPGKRFKVLSVYNSNNKRANRLLLLTENEDFINNLFMTDEAHFHLDGYVNKQNIRFLATTWSCMAIFF